jgi:hypothetical protein
MALHLDGTSSPLYKTETSSIKCGAAGLIIAVFLSSNNNHLNHASSSRACLECPDIMIRLTSLRSAWMQIMASCLRVLHSGAKNCSDAKEPCCQGLCPPPISA